MSNKCRLPILLNPIWLSFVVEASTQLGLIPTSVTGSNATNLSWTFWNGVSPQSAQGKRSFFFLPTKKNLRHGAVPDEVTSVVFSNNCFLGCRLAREGRQKKDELAPNPRKEKHSRERQEWKAGLTGTRNERQKKRAERKKTRHGTGKEDRTRKERQRKNTMNGPGGSIGTQKKRSNEQPGRVGRKGRVCSQ